MKHAEVSTKSNVEEHGGALEDFWFPAYLAFSVCFYSQRFLFGWGWDQTTRYESDMPSYLAAVKDIVWLALMGAALCSRSIGRAIDQAKRHPSVYLFLGSFCAWMALCSLIHMQFYSEPISDSVLYNLRMPLEYVPAALMAPTFVGNWRRIGITWKWLNWIAISFAAFEVIAVLGGWKQTGFDWGGLSVRFGGILGSPNDWGVYSACAIVALLAVGNARAQLLGFVPGLLLTQSRSALVGSVLAIVPLLYRPDVRRILMRTLALVLLFGFSLSYLVPPASSGDLLPEHIGLDESAASRLDEMSKFQHDFRGFDDVESLFFGVRYSHIESFYLALFARGGLAALALYTTAIGMSVVRGWKMRRISIPHLVALCVVVLISTASIFIPYPDVYPTNFYLWFAIGVLWMEPIASAPRSQPGSDLLV